ncbi:hypothetical protein GCM10010363_60990 [Streptomyces omiyaensis]|uniref:hypothetical protein n=1 Tax=Streptomyces omiyaensis TaxID=68247 RepID=UPI001671F528|nr:hypothetical protein [Streptomyces omiyaensis]GGY71450.1 hypothetical protein GCM10010363_60990 [Streptomyces omiyaensis]
MRWTVDVTLNDVDSLVSFLRAQMPESDIGSSEQAYRTHYALRTAINVVSHNVQYRLGEEAIAHAKERPDWDLERAHTIQRSWGDLVNIAREWKGVEGFDHERWVYREVVDTEEEAPASPDETAEPAVFEYRIPRARDGAAEDIVVARSAEHPESWGVFEGSTQGWHWDGSSWQHPSLTGSSPYRYTEQDALAAARRCAAAPRNPEGTDH